MFCRGIYKKDKKVKVYVMAEEKSRKGEVFNNCYTSFKWYKESLEHGKLLRRKCKDLNL
jgi:hypothetical protein